MITGQRLLPSDPGLSRAPWWKLALGIVFAGAIAWALSKGLRF